MRTRPRSLAQTKTDNDGRFEIRAEWRARGLQVSTWWQAVASRRPAKRAGNNPAIALLAVVGSKPPARVVINEMTTIASVWTHAQFLDGTTIKGHALELKHCRRQRAQLR